MSIETLINDVQEARDNLGMKRLANPKKMGAGKLQDMLNDLRMKLALEKQAAPKTWEDKWEEAGKQSEDEVAKEEALATAAAIQRLPEDKVKEPKVKKERGETVKDYACALLCEVVGQQDGRDVGMPYETVLEFLPLLSPPEGRGKTVAMSVCLTRLFWSTSRSSSLMPRPLSTACAGTLARSVSRLMATSD
ncbi:hypothetical protein [Achromobacter phage kwar_LB4]|nr:hypothetical protein [Achromobacter phage kwar_LB4]